ncbi:unnamed protein product [Amoebophrya sp. A120]|nr:unnamed protein product [Amoebophrya sp. A120]|eukprot:GSA120T00004262001.1
MGARFSAEQAMSKLRRKEPRCTLEQLLKFSSTQPTSLFRSVEDMDELDQVLCYSVDHFLHFYVLLGLDRHQTGFLLLDDLETFMRLMINPGERTFAQIRADFMQAFVLNANPYNPCLPPGSSAAGAGGGAETGAPGVGRAPAGNNGTTTSAAKKMIPPITQIPAKLDDPQSSTQVDVLTTDGTTEEHLQRDRALDRSQAEHLIEFARGGGIPFPSTSGKTSGERMRKEKPSSSSTTNKPGRVTYLYFLKRTSINASSAPPNTTSSSSSALQKNENGATLSRQKQATSGKTSPAEDGGQEQARANDQDDPLFSHHKHQEDFVLEKLDPSDVMTWSQMQALHRLLSRDGFGSVVSFKKFLHACEFDHEVVVTRGDRVDAEGGVQSGSGPRAAAEKGIHRNQENHQHTAQTSESHGGRVDDRAINYTSRTEDSSSDDDELDDDLYSTKKVLYLLTCFLQNIRRSAFFLPTTEASQNIAESASTMRNMIKAANINAFSSNGSLVM